MFLFFLWNSTIWIHKNIHHFLKRCLKTFQHKAIIYFMMYDYASHDEIQFADIAPTFHQNNFTKIKFLSVGACKLLLISLSFVGGWKFNQIFIRFFTTTTNWHQSQIAFCILCNLIIDFFFELLNEFRLLLYRCGT